MPYSDPEATLSLCFQNSPALCHSLIIDFTILHLIPFNSFVLSSEREGQDLAKISVRR